MPTATDTLPDLTELNADIKATLKRLDEAAERLLGNCANLGKAIRRSRASIEESLRRGVEATEFARFLTSSRQYGVDALSVYANLMKALKQQAGPPC